MDFKTVDDHVAAKVQIQASESGPGIVARLMGLDPLPENSNWVQKGKIPGPVMRSRSVNFMDYMLEFDLTQAKHRRVKTSASFREVPLPQGPPLLQQHNKNHEYLFVYLDNVDKNNESAAGFKTRKSEKGDGSSSKQKEKVACKKQNQEKNKKISKLKNEPRRVSSRNRSMKAGSCITGAKNVQIKCGANSKTKSPSGLTRKKKSNSDSNPVSVLNNLAAHRENGISENSRTLEPKTEKKLGLSKSEKYEFPTMDASAGISISEGLGKQESTKKNFGSTNIEETRSYMELLCKPCKLAEEDVKLSNWITKKVFTFEDFKEICSEFGEQILDLMLHQVADELGGFYMQMSTVPCHA